MYVGMGLTVAELSVTSRAQNFVSGTLADIQNPSKRDYAIGSFNARLDPGYDWMRNAATRGIMLAGVRSLVAAGVPINRLRPDAVAAAGLSAVPVVAGPTVTVMPPPPITSVQPPVPLNQPTVPTPITPIPGPTSSSAPTTPMQVTIMPPASVQSAASSDSVASLPTGSVVQAGVAGGLGAIEGSPLAIIALLVVGYIGLLGASGKRRKR